MGPFFGLPGLRFVGERSTVLPTATLVSMTFFRGLPRLRAGDSVSNPEGGCLRALTTGGSTGKRGTFLGRPGLRRSPTDDTGGTLAVFFGLPDPRGTVVDGINPGVEGIPLGRPGPRREATGKDLEEDTGEEHFLGRPGPRA